MSRSKYFTRTGARASVALSPSSPLLTTPVSTEPSYSEQRKPTSSPSSPQEQSPGHALYSFSWDMHPDLLEDLMIMLRRLKPILIQESICDDPWKLLITVRLLNVTTARVAIPVFCKVIGRWPTPQDIVDAPLNELVDLLRPLGLYNKRAKWLKVISKLYMDDPPRYPIPTPDSLPPESPLSMSQGSSRPHSKRRSRHSSYPDTPISHFPGVGPYALDSFRVFCKSTLSDDAQNDEWKKVMPTDKELIQYLRWRWACEERKIWYPNGLGVVGDVDIPYLITLVDELAERYDAMVGGEGYMYHFCADLSDALQI